MLIILLNNVGSKYLDIHEQNNQIINLLKDPFLSIGNNPFKVKLTKQVSKKLPKIHVTSSKCSNDDPTIEHDTI